MDLEKTSIIIKKINRLHDLINAIGEASSTETDLLKAYVIDLYEAVAMSDIAEVKDLEKDEMEKKLKKQKKVEKKIKKKVLKKETEKIEEEVEEIEEEEDDEIVEEIEMEVKEAIKAAAEDEEEEIVEVVKKEVKAAPAPKKSNVGYSSELLELFDLHESSELSDKLANAPIKDLTKAMGINERIFTVNELFGGNQSEMTNILQALNGLDSFEEAKKVLMDSVAQKYSWTDGSKLKKAKNFIKLIKRRFNK